MKSYLKKTHPKVYKHYLSREQSPVKDSSSNSVQVQYPSPTENLSSAALPSGSSRSQSGRVEKNKITNYGTVKPMRATVSVSKSMLLRALLSKVTIGQSCLSI